MWCKPNKIYVKAAGLEGVNRAAKFQIVIFMIFWMVKKGKMSCEYKFESILFCKDSKFEREIETLLKCIKSTNHNVIIKKKIF